MKRIVCEWAGGSVQGLAVTVQHHQESSAQVVANMIAFFDLLKGWIPDNVTVTVPDGGDLIDSATGQLTGVWSEGGGTTIAGTNAADVSAAGVGASITWLTAGIVNGKRVRGRTYVVPLATPSYDAQGTIAVSALAALDAAGSAHTTGSLVVWHRPTAPGLSDGSEHNVVSYRVRDKVSYLSSRRD